MNYMPESKRHGDRFPRTIQEAFGPHAEFHVPAEPTLKGYAISVAVALVIGLISWVCQL